MDHDVLAAVRLPAWSIFDAVFLPAQAHTNTGQGLDPDDARDGRPDSTSVARIQRWRWRVLYLAALSLLAVQVVRYTSAPASTSSSSSDSISPPPPSTAKQRSSLFSSYRSASSASTSSLYAPLEVYNASEIPKLALEQSRLTILKGIVATRASSHTFDGTAASVSVSAIIVFSPHHDLEVLKLLLQLLPKYPYIREIVVWNNDLDHQLDSSTLSFPSSSQRTPTLRVFNAPSSFHPTNPPIHRVMPPSHAKHVACGLATQQACLFIDPAFLPIHIDTLYSLYLSTGPAYAQIAAVISPEDAFNLNRLRFTNEDAGLHTGALFTRSSTKQPLPEHMVKRDWSRRFWKQVTLSTPHIPGDEADIVWSVFMNAYPALLVAPTLPSVQMPAEAPEQAFKIAQDTLLLSSLRELYSIRTSQDPFLSPDPFPLSPPSNENLHFHSPTHDDRAIMITNMDPFSRSPGDLILPATASTIDDSRGAGFSQGWLPKVWAKTGTGKSDNEPERARIPIVEGSPVSGKHFDPYTSVRSMDDYEALWTDANDTPPDADGSTPTKSSARRRGIFPPDARTYSRKLSPFLAVNGKHPNWAMHNEGAGKKSESSKCWHTPRNPVKGDFAGLLLLEPRDLRQVRILGSASFSNLVGLGEEDLTAESWEIWTLPYDEVDGPETASSSSARASGQAISASFNAADDRWVRRGFTDHAVSVPIGSTGYFEVTVTLTPYSHSDAAEEARKVREKRLIDASTSSSEDEQGGAENAEPLDDELSGERVKHLRKRQVEDILPDVPVRVDAKQVVAQPAQEDGADLVEDIQVDADPVRAETGDRGNNEPEGGREPSLVNNDGAKDTEAQAQAQAQAHAAELAQERLKAVQEDAETDSHRPQGQDDTASPLVQAESTYKVKGVKLVSRDRKGQAVQLCGFYLDGWMI